MVKKLVVIIGIILVVLILVVGGVLIGKYGLSQSAPAATQAPYTTPMSSPIVTNSPTAIATSPPAFSSPPAGSDKVNFALQITNVNVTGTLSRSITGEITNTGSIDAHNVVCEIKVYSNGKQIKISGQDSITTKLGTIAAGKTVTTTVNLTFGLLDGVTLTQNGATVNLQISSDEKTQVLTYDYKP